MVSFLLSGLARGLRLVLRSGSDDAVGCLAGRLALLYLAIYLVRNLSEADLMSQAGLSWVLAVAAVIMTDRRPNPASEAQRPGLGMHPARRSLRPA